MLRASFRREIVSSVDRAWVLRDGFGVDALRAI
jgi:hypothetical protein